MEKHEATTFEQGRSLIHTAILRQEAAIKGCQCEPYEDWFTYNRWQAQGMQVKMGEHGVRLSVFIKQEDKDAEGNVIRVHSRPWSTVVFCRDQVEPKGAPCAA